jgi:L-lactate dehydrogenase complex protein LldG
MSSSREAVIGAIRGALEEGGRGRTKEALSRNYRTGGSATSGNALNLFQDRLEDYKAHVTRCSLVELPEAILRRLDFEGIRDVVVPQDLPEAWMGRARGEGIRVEWDGVPDLLDVPGIASAQGVVSGCAGAIAETGTVVLDGGFAQGRRALTLLPDYHLCVVLASQVVETVPEAVRALEREGGRPGPLTLISGPSATSDIELVRVEGVHGPRTLDVILAEDS